MPSTAKRFDILAIGELNADLILRGEVTPEFGQVEKLIDAADLVLGSSTAIFACGAARLGLRVALVSKIGADEFGRFVLQALGERGVDASGVVIDPHGHTGLSVILNRGDDRAILTYPGTMLEVRAEDAQPDLLAEARHIHLGSYYLLDALRPGLPALLEAARCQGCTVSLDTNYDPREEWDGGIQAVLRLVDVFLPNERELRAISRQRGLVPALKTLAADGLLVAVKRGAEGALARQGAQTARAATFPVRVVDTVGAGDSFDAGFIYGFLQGWPLEQSLRLAAACGALSTRAAGGTAAQPSLGEALEYLAKC